MAGVTTNSIPFAYIKNSFVGYTDSLPTTTLFTPSEDSDYTLFIFIENLGTNGGFTGTLSWTDNAGTNSVSISGSAIHSGFAPVTIHALAGIPVTFSTAYFPGTDSSYNVFFTTIGQ